MEINTNTNINNIGYLLHMESQGNSGTDTENQKFSCRECDARIYEFPETDKTIPK